VLSLNCKYGYTPVTIMILMISSFFPTGRRIGICFSAPLLTALLTGLYPAARFTQFGAIELCLDTFDNIACKPIAVQQFSS